MIRRLNIRSKAKPLGGAGAKASPKWALSCVYYNPKRGDLHMVRIEGGYRCKGKHHMVTDELLAEGKGGCYVCFEGRKENPDWEGPFYSREEMLAVGWIALGSRLGGNGRLTTNGFGAKYSDGNGIGGRRPGDESGGIGGGGVGGVGSRLGGGMGRRFNR